MEPNQAQPKAEALSPVTMSEVETTAAELAKLREANNLLEQEFLRAEKLRSQSRMAGKSYAAPPTPEPTKAEKAAEFWKGTEIERAIKKYGA